MVGGNWGTHKALTMIGENEILVVDAGGYVHRAVWGFLQTKAAIKRGVSGIVIDGAIRDSSEISQTHLPVYCRGITPAGPHKGWKDEINVQVQCGGVVVNPGDFVKGDGDGVVIIKREDAEKVIHVAFEKLEQEKEWFKKLEGGLNTFEIVGLEDG